MKGIAGLAVAFTFLILYEASVARAEEEAPAAKAEENAPTAKAVTGVYKGQYKTSFDGNQYEAYEGIAFAHPPVGKLRFLPPVPYTEPSTEVFSANSDPPTCIQYDYHSLEIMGQEDCLYLNVYTPNSNATEPMPVIFYIHEGAFQRGRGNYTKAKYLMDKNVVLVTTNYRLGAFGFLSTEDDVVAGNMGMKDQNAALRWVHANIRAFGGDPAKITIAGASAGGTSVQLHYLSPMSAGLFRNGISFSGVAISPWAFDPKPLDSAQDLAVKANCTTETNTKMVNCLRELPAVAIANATGQLLSDLTNGYYYYPFFVPVAEKGTGEFFINRSPEEILRSKEVYDVPWITGVVSDEGGSTISSIAFNEPALTYTDANWLTLTPLTLMYDRRLPISKHAEVARAAREHYLPGIEKFKIGERPVFRGLLNMKTHAAFWIVMEKAARLQAIANKSPVYTYFYSYKAASSQTDSLSNSTFDYGVSHLDDIFLWLENDYIIPTKSEADTKMMKFIRDFWVEAITSTKEDLGLKWKQLDPETNKLDYMHIAGDHNATMQSDSNFGDKQFWDSVGVLNGLKASKVTTEKTATSEEATEKTA